MYIHVCTVCIVWYIAIIMCIHHNIILYFASSDINECDFNGTIVCDTEVTGRKCNNTFGSYHCICPEGYDFNELRRLCIG